MSTEGSRVPDGGFGWVVVFAAFLLNFVVVGMSRSFGVIYVILLETFNENAATTIWVHSLFNALRMMLAPVSSILCNRFTTRKVVLFGSVLLATGVVCSGFSTSIYFMLVSYGLVAGFGSSLLFAPSLIVITDYFEKKKGIAMSISTIGGGIGTMALPPLFTTVIGHYGFRGGMWIIGAMALNCAVSGSILRPAKHIQVISSIQVQADRKKQLGYDKNKEQCNSNRSCECDQQCEIEMKPFKENENKSVEKTESSPKNANEEIVAFIGPEIPGNSADSNYAEYCEKYSQSNIDKENKLDEKAAYPPLFKNITFLLYCSMLVTMPFCLLCVYVFIADYAREKGVKDKTKQALLVSAMGSADIVGRIVSGLIFDLSCVCHRRRLIQGFTGILFGLATLCISSATSIPMLFTVCTIHSIFEGGFHAQRATILSEIISPEQQSISIGWITFFQGLGNIIGAITGGLIKDHTSSYRVFFMMGGLLFTSTCTVFVANYYIPSVKQTISKCKDRNT